MRFFVKGKTKVLAASSAFVPAAIDEAALDALAARVVAREIDPSAAADTMTAAARRRGAGNE